MTLCQASIGPGVLLRFGFQPLSGANSRAYVFLALTTSDFLTIIVVKLTIANWIDASHE
jgi:hypothetical protein